MEIKNNIRKAALIGATVLALANPFQKVKAQSQDFQFNDIRTRVEETENQGNHFFKSTIGVSPDDNKYHEWFRAYSYEGEIKGNPIDYQVVGLVLPEARIGETKNDVTLFGNFGDIGGFGLESTHKLGNLVLTPNLESNITTGRARTGSGLDYVVNGADFGIGYDQITGSGTDKKQYFARSLWDITSGDHLNFAFAKTTEEGKPEMYSLGFGFDHHRSGRWGVLIRGRHDEKPSANWNSTVYEGIIAENSTLGWIQPTLYTSRNKSYSFDFGALESSIVIERTPIAERTNGGWAFRAGGTHNENSGKKSGNINADACYRFALDRETAIAPTISLLRTYSDEANTDKIGASLYALKKNLLVEVSINKPMEGSRVSSMKNVEFYASIQYTIPLGGKAK